MSETVMWCGKEEDTDEINKEGDGRRGTAKCPLFVAPSLSFGECLYSASLVVRSCAVPRLNCPRVCKGSWLRSAAAEGWEGLGNASGMLRESPWNVVDISYLDSTSRKARRGGDRSGLRERC